jgi:predicted nucleic acid-binding protein
MAAVGYERIRQDARIDVVPHSGELSLAAFRLFTDRTDKDWSLTDCLSFVVMGRRGIMEALTADHHFEQAGFEAVFSKAAPVTPV